MQSSCRRGERELLAEEEDYCLNYLFCGLQQRGSSRQTVAGSLNWQNLSFKFSICNCDGAEGGDYMDQSLPRNLFN